jgi:TolB protein
MLVAAFEGGAVSATPAGTGAAQLPWLLPDDGEPSIAPDGRRVAFSSPRNGDLDVYVADARTGEVTRLSTSAAADRSPAWSPDGRRVASRRPPVSA